MTRYRERLYNVGVFSTQFTNQVSSQLVESANKVMAQAIPLANQDERFESLQTATDPRICIAFDSNDNAIGYLGGSLDKQDTKTLKAEALVVPQKTRTYTEAEILVAMYECLKSNLESSQKIEMWCRPETKAHLEAAEKFDLSLKRKLFRLEVDYANYEPQQIQTRAFENSDIDKLLEINNHAFSTHPDRSNMTLESLRAEMKTSWFDSNHLRIYEQDQQIAGFCWVKMHPNPPQGEIYVLAVDPKFHRMGLGSKLLDSGLSYIRAQNHDKAFLYVESDNEAALRLYLKAGFVKHSTDSAYCPN